MNKIDAYAVNNVSCPGVLFGSFIFTTRLTVLDSASTALQAISSTDPVLLREKRFTGILLGRMEVETEHELHVLDTLLALQTNDSLLNLLPDTLFALPELPGADKDTLRAMAASCPAEWGGFISKARAWVSSFDTTDYFFHDCEIPSQAAYAKLGEIEKNNRSQKKELKVYPNPANEFLHISGEMISTGGRYLITDLSGVVKTQGIIQDDGFIHLSTANLQNGLYLISIVEGNGSTGHTRFVICR